MGNRYHVGVDLGGTNLKYAIVDADGAIVTRTQESTEAQEGHGAVLGRMVSSVQGLVDSVAGEVVSIGVGVPGELDMAAGETRDLPNLPDRWIDVPVADQLRAETGFPTYLINDVRAFTVAESELGAARGAVTALCVAVGTGIGGGVVAHGQVLFGLGGAAGELGHIIVAPEGPRCSCGNRGCAEAFASGPAIVSEANRHIAQGFTTRLVDLVADDLNKMTPEVVARAADDGDEVATEVLERAGYYLGLALASAIAMIAPEVVVIGGGVARPGGIYWRAAEETARSHSHVTEIEKIAFTGAALGYDAGVVGAAWWGARQVRGRG